MKRVIVLAIFAMVLTACAGGNQVAQVTAIPTNDTPTATLTPTADDLAATAEPTEAAAAEDDTVTVADGEPTFAPTFTPGNFNLEFGEARAIAYATDTGMSPIEGEPPLTFTEFPVRVTFDEFYAGFDMRKGYQVSDKVKSLDGVEVVMEGYMAPPLKPSLDWFVLTRVQLAVCPFCSTDSDWPNDIALIYMPEDNPSVATQFPVRIRGTMEVGSSIDAETGMVSLVRIYADTVEVVN